MENLSEHLKENVTYINGLFENAMDYIEREFMVGTVPAALLTMDGLVSKQHITLSILNPLMRAKIPTDNGKETLLFIEENVLCAVEQAELSTVSEVLERMMNGFAVLLLDNCPTALAFGTQGFAARGVDEPDTEVMQRGSREGFVETYQTNISLLRRRLKTTELKFEKVTVGEESQTPAALCYLKNIADPKIINTLKKRLSACNLKDVLAAGYLAGYLERPAIFDRVGFTERPDTLCGKLHEGRIGLLIDGTPTALYVPYLFVENFQTADDYANRPFYATFTRWLKYIAFFLAIFLPGLYVGIAVTVITGYTVPKLYEPMAVLRLIFILVGGIWGVWGVLAGFTFLLFELCGKTSFSVPFLAPVAPFRLSAMRDVLVRAGWKRLVRHNASVQHMPGAGKGEKHL